jgi:serine O-acetyltransferase
MEFRGFRGPFGVLTLYIDEPSCWAITEYRFRKFLYNSLFKIPVLGLLMHAVYKLTLFNIIYEFTGVDIHIKSEIGPGFMINHGNGLIVGGQVKMGKNCTLYHQVTLGNMRGEPTIGNNVHIYTGSKIFGPVKIGSNVIIGANSVVDKSLRSNIIAAGNPAKILRKSRKSDFINRKV